MSKTKTLYTYENGDKVFGIALYSYEYEAFIRSFSADKKKFKRKMITRLTFGWALIALAAGVSIATFVNDAVGGFLVFFGTLLAMAFGVGSVVENLLSKTKVAFKFSSNENYRIENSQWGVLTNSRSVAKHGSDDTVREIAEIMVKDAELMDSKNKLSTYVDERLESIVSVKAADSIEDVKKKLNNLADRFAKICRSIDEKDYRVFVIEDSYVDERDAEVLREIEKVEKIVA